MHESHTQHDNRPTTHTTKPTQETLGHTSPDRKHSHSKLKEDRPTLAQADESLSSARSVHSTDQLTEPPNPTYPTHTSTDSALESASNESSSLGSFDSDSDSDISESTADLANLVTNKNGEVQAKLSSAAMRNAGSSMPPRKQPGSYMRPNWTWKLMNN